MRGSKYRNVWLSFDWTEGLMITKVRLSSEMLALEAFRYHFSVPLK